MEPRLFLPLLAIAAAAGLVLWGRSGVRTVLTVRNTRYFDSNGDGDWRERLSAFTTLSVKIADGQTIWRENPQPLIEAGKAAGCEIWGWVWLYASPYWNNKRQHATAVESARAEAEAHVRALDLWGLDTLVVNVEKDMFGCWGAKTEGTNPRAALRAYCERVLELRPGTRLVYNGLTYLVSYKTTAGHYADGIGLDTLQEFFWAVLPMAYRDKPEDIAEVWETAAGKFPGLAWGVMTGAKPRYFPGGAVEAAVSRHKPDIIAFFYGPNSRLSATAPGAASTVDVASTVGPGAGGVA